MKELYCGFKSSEFNPTLEDYKQSNEERLTSVESVQRIKYFIENNHITDHDMDIFNTILNNVEIISKLVWVWDGSYLNNRIFYKRFNFDDMNTNAFMIEGEYGKYCRGKSTIDDINRDFDTIFICLISDEKAYESKLWSDQMDRMDRMSYDY